MIWFLVIGVASSACQQSKDQDLIPPASGLIASESLEGKWVLKSRRPGFPAAAPHVAATTNESYEFIVDKLSYTYFVDNKVKEQGKFNLTMATNSSSNQMTISFSGDTTSASLAFKEGMVVIGNRIPKGAILIDYNDYHYFAKQP